MSVSFYDLTVASYLRTVEAMSNVLDKGADYCKSESIPLDEIVAARLRPDMANFHFQITSITHHSIGAVNAYRSGEFRPPDFDDCDYAALQAMTTSTLEELRTVSRDEIDALSGGRVTFKMKSMEIPFTAVNFALAFSLPNFYFHATTGYDILRSKGAPIGKLDFLGNMPAGV